jgi:hypothetical protein
MSPSSAGSGASGSCSVLSGGVFVAEEVDEIGDTWSGDTTTVNVETLLDVFWENFQDWDYSPQLPKYQDFQSISIRITGILLFAYECVLWPLTSACQDSIHGVAQ